MIVASRYRRGRGSVAGLAGMAGVALLALVPSNLAGQGKEAAPNADQGALTLVESVSLALGHHPAVGQARARREAAQGRLDQAVSALLPSVATDASLVRHQEPMLVAPLHGFDPTAAPSFDRNLVRGNLSLRYSLYDGGAREARIRGARAGTEAARAGEASARMEVVMETGEAYLDILSTRELLEAARGQREALEAERSRVLQLLEVGKAARVDLLRVDAALSRSEATEISLEAGLDVARGKLARLTGLSPADVRERSLLPVRLRVTGAPELPVALARAREGSPDLTAARRHRAVAVAAVREARSDWLPTVQLAGVYSNFGALEGGHTQEWQGSLQLSFPLFTGGSREGNLDRAEAEAQEAAEALRLAELRVEDAVEAARAAVVEARARRDALERGVQQAGEVARIEALALEVGSGVQTDFLQAQAELFQARASLAQARHAEMMASVRLARVSGELTLGWFQENMEVMP